MPGKGIITTRSPRRVGVNAIADALHESQQFMPAYSIRDIEKNKVPLYGIRENLNIPLF